MNSSLTDSIQYLKGVGPKLAGVFSRKGLSTFEDALYFLPRAFEDRSQVVPLCELTDGAAALVCGKVSESRWIGGRFRRQFEAIIADNSGHSLRLHWFHTFPTLAKVLAKGNRVIVFGEVTRFQGRLQMNHPEYENCESDVKEPRSTQFQGVFPIYLAPEGLSQKVVRKVVRGAVNQSMPLVRDMLPVEIRNRLGLCTLSEAFQTFHLPESVPSNALIQKARDCLVFDEFFMFQLGLLMHRESKDLAPVMAAREAADCFVGTLPFTLTSDQKRAIDCVLADMARPRPMTRLLQGDVGCGKTVIAFAAASVAAASGYQTVIMVPTEVLAEQHQRTALKLLRDRRVVLLSHGAATSVRDSVFSGEANIIIGTHAVFQKRVEFFRLGLVIVDEQHRFGVRQRVELIQKAKGVVPHQLMMTATPIPRSLSLTLYGDLDLTLVREKPSDRRPIRTRFLASHDRTRLYEAIRRIVTLGQQVYVIYPLVEESEKVDLRSATQMFEELSRVFAQVKVALVHGRMESEEKSEVLERFRGNHLQILVATTVVEVGIDVPNATLMVIEHAERLGLSQLHQLRGRVGRGSLESECILVSHRRSERLEVLVKTQDGFEIAEADLKLRGAGEFLGTRQSGGGGFRLGDISADSRLLVLAHEEASRVLGDDPQLISPENTKLKDAVLTRWQSKLQNLAGG